MKSFLTQVLIAAFLLGYNDSLLQANPNDSWYSNWGSYATSKFENLTSLKVKDQNWYKIGLGALAVGVGAFSFFKGCPWPTVKTSPKPCNSPKEFTVRYLPGFAFMGIGTKLLHNGINEKKGTIKK